MEETEKQYLIKFILDDSIWQTIIEEGALNNCSYTKGSTEEEALNNKINVSQAIDLAKEEFGKFNYKSPVLCGNMYGSNFNNCIGFFYLIFNPITDDQFGDCIEFCILPAYLTFVKDFSIDNQTIYDHIDLDKYIRIGLTFCRDFPIRKLEVLPIE